MDVTFADEDLRHLWTDESATGKFPKGIVEAYRKRLNAIYAAPDERVFYKMTSLRFEKLQGQRQHQCSMRLNRQYRLILELHEDGKDKGIRIVGIENYH